MAEFVLTEVGKAVRDMFLHPPVTPDEARDALRQVERPEEKVVLAIFWAQNAAAASIAHFTWPPEMASVLKQVMDSGANMRILTDLTGMEQEQVEQVLLDLERQGVVRRSEPGL